MAKFTYKEIKEIIRITPDELKGKEIYNFRKATQVGFFHPSNANWSYQVFAVEHNERIILVTVVFGYVK